MHPAENDPRFWRMLTELWKHKSLKGIDGKISILGTLAACQFTLTILLIGDFPSVAGPDWIIVSMQWHTTSDLGVWTCRYALLHDTLRAPGRR